MVEGVAMTEKPNAHETLARRGFLRSAGALAGGAAVIAGAKGALAETAPDTAITELKDWNQYLGYGVDATGYGVPASFEENTIRRWVPWLTASPESSVNFSPLYDLSRQTACISNVIMVASPRSIQPSIA